MWRRWWNRFVAADPALRRLRTAIRIAAATALALALASAWLTLSGVPVSRALLAAVVAINATLSVNDATLAQRKITTALMPLPPALSLLLAALTQPWPLLHIGMFLLIIFVATYIRRFGPRFFALGMLAFMGYFFAMFLKPTVAQFPALVVVACCGAGAAFLLRFVVLRDAPAGMFDRGRRTMLAQVESVLASARDLARQPESVKRRQAVRDHLTRLNEAAIALENTTAQLDSLSEQDRERLAQRVLDVELATENVLNSLLNGLSSEERAAVGTALLVLVDAPVRQRRPRSRDLAERVERDGSPTAAMSVRRVGADLADLGTAAEELLAAPVSGTEATSPAPPEAASGAAPEETGWQRPELRAAVQVTTATALAIACGHLIAPNRWYWAVITAFVVFISVRSRGELLVRAWQRTAGTMVGVIAGMGLASLLSGDTALELVAILVCIFLAFYFTGYSYTLMTLFITTVLAVMYGILGTFSVGVLGTRLAETLVGAGAAVLASTLVLPTHTRTVVRARLHDFLASLRDFTRATGTALSEQRSLTGLRATTRELDSTAHQLRHSARPLVGARPRSGHTSLDRGLTMVLGCAYYTRNLTVLLDRVQPLLDEDTRNRLAEMLWAIAVAADVLAGDRSPTAGPDFEEALAPAFMQSRALHDIAETPNSETTSLRRALRFLDRIAHTLTELAAELGVASSERLPHQR